MSNNCEQLRQMLVELEYGELDAMDATAVQIHLGECDSCAKHLAAYRAVRADLKTWDDVAPVPSRITFVTMPREQPASGWGRWSRGGAIAASFLMGLLLTAAAANFRLSHDDSGWSASTSLWPSGTPSVPVAGDQPAATSPTGPTSPVANRALGANSQLGDSDAISMREADLSRWLDSQLRARGLHAVGGAPNASLSQEQLLALQSIVAASERRQQQEFDSLLAGTYQAFDVQRTEDLLFLAGELGLMQESTGLELQRTNAALDYLITRAADTPRQREQQNDDN